MYECAHHSRGSVLYSSLTLCSTIPVLFAPPTCIMGISPHASSSIAFLMMLVLLLQLDVTHSQYNNCLRPPGCYRDECCFNIVPKTGEKCAKLEGCNHAFGLDCCRNSRPVYTPYGIMYGYAIQLDDPYSYREDALRYLQIWQGVPYAKAPSRDKHLRFLKPIPPDKSSAKYDATYYRPACPQPKEFLKGLTQQDTDEDCLHLNIFVMNYTLNPSTRAQLYPIVVYFHGGEHMFGSARYFPGHILAQLNVMVVTVQYRLNAFGFVSTEDPEARGNYGLWDQLAALQFIYDHAEQFRGDRNRITLMGYGSGAADVALHMLSKKSGLLKSHTLFHRAILLGGSDLMDGGFVRYDRESLSYTRELAFQSGCTQVNNQDMMACLRGRSADELAGAASKVFIHRPGWVAKPWSPTVDGEFIEDYPINLRRSGQFAVMPVIGGVAADDGSAKAQELFPNITKGFMTDEEFEDQLMGIAQRDFAYDHKSVVQALKFEYTYWPNQKNDTMRLRMFRQLFTDRYFGAGLEESLKYQADIPQPKNQTQLLVFQYRSASDPSTKYLGAYHESMLQYIFGFVYLNNSDYSELGLVPRKFYYRDLDRNVTDYMLYMFSNFITHGNATPDIIRNLTWDTFRSNNRTYLLVNLQDDFENGFNLLQDYHVFHYAFWRVLYERLLLQAPRFTTPMPTPAYVHSFKAATFSLAGILGLLLVLILCLTIVLLRRQKMFVSSRRRQFY